MKTSIATVSLSGELPEKLAAIAEVGFDGYELFENDLTFSSASPAHISALTADLGLELFALQPFRDFEGLLDTRRSDVFERAERKFDLMEVLGTDRLLIPSTVSPHATERVDRYVDDLRELGDRAERRGFRIGYEALAWGRHVRDWTKAWDIVEQVDHPAVGLVLDTYHLFVRGNPISPLRDVPAEKITMVQLADAPSLDMEVLRHSRHLRNFPGQGDYPIVDFLAELVAIGYDDVLSHEIFNDEFRIAPTRQTAVDGHRSMLWLDEQLTKRERGRATGIRPRWTPTSTPIPNTSLEHIAFVEFAATEAGERSELDSFFTAMGFTRSHRHKRKPVDVYNRGGAHLLINADPDHDRSTLRPESLAGRHGAAACSIGFATADPAAALTRASTFHAPEVTGDDRLPAEAYLPAVTGLGDIPHRFVGTVGPRFLETDFDEVATAVDEPVLRFDHIGIAVAPHELLSALLFARSVLGLERHPTHELVDPHGLVTSRAVQSPTGGVRLALTTSSGADTSPERFRAAAQGSGVQHIAIATDSLTEVAASIDPAILLSIPENYYADLATRVRLDDRALSELQDHNMFYDETDDGTFRHLYTREIQGVFFEFVERSAYLGLGAANAPVRLAAQARSNGPNAGER